MQTILKLLLDNLKAMLWQEIFQIAEIELCYGKMNKDGLGIPKNLEEAHKHFTIAAAKGNADAIEELKHIKKGLFGWKII